MNTIHEDKTLTSLTGESLALPQDLKSFHISQELCRRFPNKAVVQVSEHYFDLPEFIDEGQCAARMRPDLFHDFYVGFAGLNAGLHEETENACYEVDWQGETLEIVLVSWQEGHCKSKHYWIIAETEPGAKEFYHQVCQWCAEVRGEVLVFDSGRWYKDETLFHAIQNATFENLILPPKLKQELQDDFAQFFASRNVYERYRIPWKRGVLLIGPPGNGKTHTVKALINWLGVPSLYVKSFKVQYSTDQTSIREVFRRARQTTPCLLIMEDLDSLIDDNNRSFFLNELDGFASNTGIVVLATTNHPERLDPALINRPSRFDRKYYFELPDDVERRAYLCAWNATLENELQMDEATIAATVSSTAGFSFAYLKELFLSAMMRWISSPEKAPMKTVVAEQCLLLREQMHAMNDAPPAETDPQNEMMFPPFE